MSKWLIALLAGALMMPVAPATMANGEGGTYLALGDSVAAGTQQPAPFTDNGYTNNLFRYLEELYGFDKFVNLACPGDDTAEMVNGVGGLSSNGSNCYGLPPVPASQLDAAVGYLKANPGEVRLITIVIGANDLLACDPTDPPPVLNACVAAQLGQIGVNLPIIIVTLKAMAPGVPIVAMNYYNPNLAFWLTGPAGQELAKLSLGLTAAFNDTLHAIYYSFGVPVADVETTYKTFKTEGGDPPQNVRATCLWTRMCERLGPEYVLSEQPDIHPSNKGYKKVAGTHADLIDNLGILD